MRRIILIITVILAIVGAIAGTVIYNENLQIENEIGLYEQHVSSFERLDANKANSKIELKEAFILYVGRNTCPWCRKLTPLLSKLSLEHDLDIYYLDSTNTKSDLKLKRFRDIYEVEYVPTLLIFDDNGAPNTISIDITSENYDFTQLENDTRDFLAMMPKK